jgi:hypothetical protein
VPANRLSFDIVEDKVNPILARYNASIPFSVQERDIDLLLIEQLHVCHAFADWLTGRLDLPGAVVETARHSVYREHGETDVLVIVRVGDENVAVMLRACRPPDNLLCPEDRRRQDIGDELQSFVASTFETCLFVVATNGNHGNT